MFVTSDIFDLAKIAWDNGVAGWRERLVGGIGIHGTDYPGAEAAARFLASAAEICGLRGQLPIAGYSLQWGEPSEHIDQSLIAELARGALPGASGAESVYLQGPQGDLATHDRVLYGGGLAAAPPTSAAAENETTPESSNRFFDGDFVFPLNGQGTERAEALLRSSAEILHADYGYYFVRDVFAQAHHYAQGPGLPVDRSRLGRADETEVDLWRTFVGEGELWTGVWPQLRDLFEVNLLSERHLSAFIEPIGYLGDWIAAEPGRGRLAEVGDGRVLWSLTDAEIHAVRPTLWDVHLMRTCMPRVYRDLPYARQRPDPDTGKVSEQNAGT